MTVFISKGDDPLSVRQATTRGIQILAKELGQAGARTGDERLFAITAHADLPQRLVDVLSGLPLAPATYVIYAEGWETDNNTNAVNNHFNHMLLAYKKAVLRLARYRLADGRAEVIEQIPNGEIDEAGEPVTEPVVTVTAIDPVDAQIEIAVIDQDTGAQTGTEMVANPLITADEQERATAQATIDQIPQSVADFYAGL